MRGRALPDVGRGCGRRRSLFSGGPGSLRPSGRTDRSLRRAPAALHLCPEGPGADSGSLGVGGSTPSARGQVAVSAPLLSEGVFFSFFFLWFIHSLASECLLRARLRSRHQGYIPTEQDLGNSGPDWGPQASGRRWWSTKSKGIRWLKTIQSREEWMSSIGFLPSEANEAEWKPEG